MTIKQRLTAKEMVENGGNMASAMRKAGYSDAMVKNPHKVKSSKGFKEVLKIMGISDERLVQILSEGLNSYKLTAVKADSESTFNVMPDFGTRHKYLLTVLELKGYIGKNANNLTNDSGNVVFVNDIPRPARRYEEVVRE